MIRTSKKPFLQRLREWLAQPINWVGAISVVALIAMIVPTLRVGRPISDDYCGYISTSPGSIFSFTFDTYQTFMANIVGFGLYEVFSNLALIFSAQTSLQIYWLCSAGIVAIFAWSVTYFLQLGGKQQIRSEQLMLWVALCLSLALGLFVTSPTGSVGNLTLATLTTTTGIFHLWPPLLGGSILFYVLANPLARINLWKFGGLVVATLLVVLMGHAESIVFLALIFFAWLVSVLWLQSRHSNPTRLKQLSRLNALGLGGLLGLAVLLLSPGSKAPLAVLLGSASESSGASANAIASDTSLGGFIVYLASYSQDSLGRAFGHGVLILVAILAMVAGYLLSASQVRSTTIARAVLYLTVGLPVVVVVTSMGEYFGYPAWYHEIILNVLAVTLAILLGLLVGAALPKVASSPIGRPRWGGQKLLNSIAVLTFAALTTVGAAAFLSRVEYLQERADRWDAGYFTTIVSPIDGSLILPDGDSGILWVAQCARDFANLRGLQFNNYRPAVQ